MQGRRPIRCQSAVVADELDGLVSEILPWKGSGLGLGCRVKGLGLGFGLKSLGSRWALGCRRWFRRSRFETCLFWGILATGCGQP